MGYSARRHRGRSGQASSESLLRVGRSPSARHTGPGPGGSLNNRNGRKLPVPRTAGWTCPPSLAARR
jgi:hypothetical protein